MTEGLEKHGHWCHGRAWKSTEDPSPGVFIKEFITIDFLVSFFPIMCGHIQLYLYEYYLRVSIDR